MGQEIVYCFKCQTRIVGADFSKGSAYQIGDNLCCSKCAAEILHTLPSKERERLLAQMFKATQERRSGGTSATPQTDTSAKLRSLAAPPGPPGGVERRKSSDTARRRWAQQSRRSMWIAGIAVVGVAAVVLIMILSGGGSGPASRTVEPLSRATPPPDVSKDPAPEPEDSRKAREFARAHPDDVDGQIAAWRGALLAAPKKPDADAAQKEIDRLLPLQKKAVEVALASLDAQTGPTLANEEFAVAIGLMKTARPKLVSPEWTLAVDRRIEKARADVGKLLPDLKVKAGDARRRGATEELNALQARVRKWGQSDLQSEFEAALADTADPATPAPKPDPSPGKDPPVSKEADAYRSRWNAALFRAVQGDTPGASKEITAAMEPIKEAALRAEAAEDLDWLRAIGLAMAEIKESVARTPKGQKVSLERWNAAGLPEKVGGTVAGSEPGRILIRTDVSIIRFEIGELTPGVIADLFAARPGRKPGDDRTAALLGILAGDLERAARLKVAIPERWQFLASKAVAMVNAGPEAEARRIYAEAEEAASDPVRVSIAIRNYQSLLTDHAATAFVGRNRTGINARSTLGKEYLFFPDTLKGAGTFKFGKAGKVDAAWLSERDSDPAAAAQNYVELSFTALPDADYRLWIYAGACCLETFAFGVQGTELPLATARATIAEPGSAIVIPIRPTPSLKKTHAMHGGPKSPVRWEWIPIPIPKYPTPGVKVVRLLTDQQGFAVAYAGVSSLTSSAPRESEVMEIDRARPRRREEPRAPAAEKELPGLVAYWPLDEGSGASTAERAGRVKPGALQGRPAWAAGRWGRALRFDGGDSWVDLPGVPALNNIMEGSFTISVWFQPDDLPPGKEPANNAAYAIVVREGWHQGIGYGNDGSFFFSQYFCRRDDESKPLHVNAGTKAFPAGVFHHLACGLDREASRLFIYVDGNLEGTAIVDATLKSWKYPAPWRLGIGAPGGAENRWCAKGVIDDVRFYNRALSPTEVQALYRPTPAK